MVEMITVMVSINGYGKLVSPWGQILVVVQQSRISTNAVKLFKGQGKGFGWIALYIIAIVLKCSMS